MRFINCIALKLGKSLTVLKPKGSDLIKLRVGEGTIDTFFYIYVLKNIKSLVGVT